MVILRTISFIIILFLFRTAEAQSTFSKRIDVERWTYPSQVIQLADGGFIISGFYSLDSSGINQNFCIIKTDESGNLLWVKSADLPVVPRRDNANSVISVTPTHDSGFAIAIPITPVYNSSFILAKFDYNGIKQWANQINATSSFIGMTIVETADHGFAAGYSGDNITAGLTRFDSLGKLLWFNGIFRTEFLPYSSPSLFESADGGFVIGKISRTKFSAEGKVLWSFQDSTQQFSLTYSIAKTSDGGSVMCGAKENSQIFTRNLYVIKYNSSGKKVWDITVDVFSDAEGHAITEAANGDIIVTGFEFNNLCILRLSKDGETKQYKTLAFPNFTNGVGVIPTRDDGVAILGWVRKGVDTTFENPDYSMLFMKMDSALEGCHLTNTLFSSQSGSEVLDSSYSIVTDTYLDTVAQFLEFKSLLNVQEIDECIASSVSDTKVSKNSIISFYPNPITSPQTLTISLSEELLAGLYDLTLLDLLGNTIKKEKVNFTGARQDIVFDISECAAGVYIVELRNESDQVRYRMKLIKQ